MEEEEEEGNRFGALFQSDCDPPWEENRKGQGGIVDKEEAKQGLGS